MRAVVKTGPGPGCEFVEDRTEPDLLPGQVRVEVAAASVCGTDAAFYTTGAAGGDLTMSYPRTMGHEMAGVVVEVGADARTESGGGASVHSDASGVRVGDRVAVETHLHCGRCWFCLAGLGHNCANMGVLGVTVDGAFAERCVVPTRSCYRLPEEIPTDTAALLEPAGSAMHGVLRSGVSVADASVLISGAGPVGAVAAQVVTALGARSVVVVEPNEHRRTLMETFGASCIDTGTAPLDAADATTRTLGGFDLALECSGARPALTAAIGAVRREGTVVSIGLVHGEIPVEATDTLITRGVTLRGSWGRSIWDTWDQLTDLVVSGAVNLDALITHRLPLSGLPQALDLMRSGAGKVLLLPRRVDTHTCDTSRTSPPA